MGELAGLLIRPDGYVAWASAVVDPEGLPDALTSWFGVPAAAAATTAAAHH
ncbi:aromatic-ring hydroxylase C-terminal domain-containing protein [Nonomuraea cypriaca]|uniref:aromatic-ring hydroxylase C-terminal domain-containing protein n=1 Tax=Nonomuraea cypriaca TaxID=1187855 RepID=UPI002E2D9884|nr:hypothetical protein [Nonomuraea cypriaca]